MDKVPQAKNTEEGSKEGSQEACSYETSSQEDPKEGSQEACSQETSSQIVVSNCVRNCTFLLLNIIKSKNDKAKDPKEEASCQQTLKRAAKKAAKKPLAMKQAAKKTQKKAAKKPAAKKPAVRLLFPIASGIVHFYY